MKTFENNGAQGDLWVVRVDSIPEGLTPKKPDSREGFVVAHSETGHHHAIPNAPGIEVLVQDALTSYLRVENGPAQLIHHKPDGHETLNIPTGIFKMRRQTEMTPQGWAQVND